MNLDNKKMIAGFLNAVDFKALQLGPAYLKNLGFNLSIPESNLEQGILPVLDGVWYLEKLSENSELGNAIRKLRAKVANGELK